MRCPSYVRFSNRPSGVKRFQTIRHHSADVARGLVLLFGIGTRALPSWNSKTGWNNLYRGLVRRATGPSGHTNSPHPSSREGHLSTAWWNASFLLSHLVTCVPHATAASRVHRNSVPSTQMRCMGARFEKSGKEASDARQPRLPSGPLLVIAGAGSGKT